MPERNLVAGLRNNKRFILLVATLTVAAMQPGCSKLRQSKLDRDFLDSGYVERNWSAQDEPATNRAKIVATSSDSQKTSNSVAKILDSNCDHQANCDCFKKQLKPKLPFAEPIELPALAITVPPPALISQPLAPILFDGKTREVQVTEHASGNSLRRNSHDSIENPAALTHKPDFVPEPTTSRIVAAETAHPIRLASSETPVSQTPVSQTSRNYDWRDSPQTEIADLDPTTAPPSELAFHSSTCVSSTCVSSDCVSSDCDGSCQVKLPQAESPEVQPVVESEQVIMAATTSVDWIPPFAECPPIDETIEISEVENFAPETAPAIAETRKLDDLNDDEWVELFGAATPHAPSCPVCQSSECQDPKCGLALVDGTTDLVSGDFQTAEQTDFQPRDQTGFQAAPIEVTASPESSKDFSPTSHAAEIRDTELEFEYPEFDLPEKSAVPPIDVSQSIPHLDRLPAEGVSFAPVNSGESDSIPAREENPTAELSKIETLPVPVPDGEKGLGKQMSPRDTTISWGTKLADSIQSAKTQLAQQRDPEVKNKLEVDIRLLEILDRQMAEVQQRQVVMTDADLQASQHQLNLITLLLDSNDSSRSDLDRHNAMIGSVGNLRQIVDRLESMDSFQVSNGEFCTEVSGFGQFKRFPSNSFGPSQRLLVYCEVENQSSDQAAVDRETQYVTRLRGSYSIYDQQGRVVQQSDYPIVEDVAKSRRHDFYMHFPIQLGDLALGQYQLVLLVEDLNGTKSASIQPGMAFEVQ